MSHPNPFGAPSHSSAGGMPDAWRPPAPAASSGSPFLLLAVLSATAFVVVAVAAYLFRGDAELDVAFGAGAIGLVVWALVAFRSGLGWSRGAVLGVCGIAAWSAWPLVWLMFGGATVYVDNFSQQNVQLLLDGNPWLAAGKDSTQKVVLKCNTYKLTVQPAAGGAALDEMTVEVTDDGPFVLNVLGAQSYYRETVVYGSMPLFGGNGPTIITDRWFAAKADYVFTHPPESIEVKQNNMFATRTHLGRGSPPGFDVPDEDQERSSDEQ